MGRAKRTPCGETALGRYEARDRMNARGVTAFFETRRRQNGWDTLREHRLAGPRRSEKQHVMAASHRDFDRALRVILASDFAKVFVLAVVLDMKGRPLFGSH